MLAFFVAFAGLAIVLEGAVGVLAGPGGWWRRAGRGVVALSTPPLVAVALLYAVLWRWGGWTGSRLRVASGGALWRGVGLGLAWGLSLAALVLVAAAAGGARLAVAPGGDERYLAVALPVAVGLLLAALLEELLFRGFPLARLAEAVGPAAASGLLAGAFVLAHAGNPAVGALGLVNIGLASLLLSAAFFSPGGLPAAVGLHFAWNAGLVLAADAPVSGLRFGLPTLEFLPGSRPWLTGGAFGPEGGVGATLVLSGALGWWLWAGARHREAKAR